MRDMLRNKRTIRYSVPTTTTPILDAYGNDTLEEQQNYADPVELRVNISANAGQDVVETFGGQTEYSRTISITGASCPLVEGTKVWFGDDVYVVVKVADSKNSFLIALREVSGGG